MAAIHQECNLHDPDGVILRRYFVDPAKVNNDVMVVS